MKKFVCEECGREFEARADHEQRFCSRQCSGKHLSKAKRKYEICPVCGEEFERVDCHVGENNFCSKECVNQWNKENRKGENANRWQGGIHYQDGYIFKKEKDGGYRGEHRILMEEHLGRKLSSNEVVHHIDGNKTNNDLDNLVVMTRAEHALLHRPVDKRIKNNK